ncbi:MAG: DUF4405 domain-containing protein [Chloroflexota bacterium]
MTSELPASSRRNQARAQVRMRGLIAVSMLALWSVVTATGFLLYFTSGGPRTGRLVTLFLTKQQWGDLHFWMSIAAEAMTLIHLIVNWNALKACARFLMSDEGGQEPC